MVTAITHLQLEIDRLQTEIDNIATGATGALNTSICAFLYNLGPQAINTNAIANFSNTGFLNGITFSTSNTLTILTAGNYLINVSINSAPGIPMYAIFKNGIMINGSNVAHNNNTESDNIVITIVHNFNVNDKITLRNVGNAGSLLNVGTNIQLTINSLGI